MPQSIVPTQAMDSVPITGLQELEDHLDKLIAEPERLLAPKLFDDVELQLTDANIPPLLPSFLPKLTTVLKTTQQDPKPVVSLTIKLLSPVSFAQTLSLADEASLITALTSPAPSANILGMTLLEKAASSASDASQLANMPRVLEEFIRRWLVAPEVEVGEKGSRVLVDLLEVDSEVAPLQQVRHAVTIDGVAWTNGPTNGVNGNRKPTGSGQLWRRITQDPVLIGLLLSISNGRDAAGDELSQHQTSLAQGRLLRVLPRLAALDFNSIARPLGAGGADVPMGGTSEHADSLLRFVAVSMVDKKDMLMHLSLIDFFEALLSLMRIRVDQGGIERAYIITTLKQIVTEATREDNVLKAALLNLPDRTVPEEAEGLKAFILEVVV